MGSEQTNLASLGRNLWRAALWQRPNAAAMRLPKPSPPNACRLQGHQQMHVVGHQHTGVGHIAISHRRGDEPISIVAALDDVQRLTRQKISAKTGHGAPPATAHLADDT